MIGAMQAFEPIPTRGEIFDPRIHEAVEVANTREAEDGRILQELQRGYTLGDQLVRPADRSGISLTELATTTSIASLPKHSQPPADVRIPTVQASISSRAPLEYPCHIRTHRADGATKALVVQRNH